MDDLPNIHDLIHVGSLAFAVWVLWSRFDRHEKRDDERFDAHQKRMDEIADRWVQR